MKEFGSKRGEDQPTGKGKVRQQSQRSGDDKKRKLEEVEKWAEGEEMVLGTSSEDDEEDAEDESEGDGGLGFYSCDDDEDDEDTDEDEGDEAKQAVNVDFSFTDPKEEYYHSIRQFLSTRWTMDDGLNVSELADIVVQQVVTGTMITVDNESDVYGFMTCLNFQLYHDKEVIKKIQSLVVQKAPTESKEKLQNILQQKSVGLVITERLVNLPYQLVSPLVQSLHDDIDWARTNEDTEELRKAYEFDYFLVMSRCYFQNESKNNKKHCSGSLESTNRFYYNFEDEFVEQKSELWYSFQLPENKHCENLSVRNGYVVMLVEPKKHASILQDLKNLTLLNE